MDRKFVDELDRLEREGEMETVLDGLLDAQDQRENDLSLEYPTEDGIRGQKSILEMSYADEQGLSELVDLLGDSKDQDIRGVYAALHDKIVESRALQLRLNHAELQVSSLLVREAEYQMTLTELRHFLAEAEQAKLLLEMKLKDVTTFQQYSGHPATIPKEPNVEDVRGRLLEAANKRILDLESELQELQIHRADETFRIDKNLAELEATNISIREEMRSLSDQLAQRTVLYSAQERRWKEGTHVHVSSNNSLQREVDGLRLQMKQLQQMYAQCETDKVEALVALKQSEHLAQSLRSELDESEGSLARTQEDLFAAHAQLSTMTNVIDRLRGSDVSDIETSMVVELDIQRAAFRDREEKLLQQLELANSRLHASESRRMSATRDLAAAQGSFFSEGSEGHTKGKGNEYDIDDGDSFNVSMLRDSLDGGIHDMESPSLNFKPSADIAGISMSTGLPEDMLVGDDVDGDNRCDLPGEIQSMREQLSVYVHREVLLMNGIKDRDERIIALEEQLEIRAMHMEVRNLQAALADHENQLMDLTKLYCESEANSSRGYCFLLEAVSVFVKTFNRVDGNKVLGSMETGLSALSKSLLVFRSLPININEEIQQMTEDLSKEIVACTEIQKFNRREDMMTTKKEAAKVSPMSEKTKKVIEQAFFSFRNRGDNDFSRINHVLDRFCERIHHVAMNQETLKTLLATIRRRRIDGVARKFTVAKRIAVAAGSVQSDLSRFKSSMHSLSDQISRERTNFQQFIYDGAQKLKTVTQKTSSSMKSSERSTSLLYKTQLQNLYRKLRSLKHSHDDLRSSMAPLTFELNVQFTEDITRLISWLREDSRRYAEILHGKLHAFKKEYRARIKEKYHMKAEALLQAFTKEREEILTVVKFECSEILSDAKALISGHVPTYQSENLKSKGRQSSVSIKLQRPIAESARHVWSSVLDSADSGESIELPHTINKPVTVSRGKKGSPSLSTGSTINSRK